MSSLSKGGLTWAYAYAPGAGNQQVLTTTNPIGSTRSVTVDTTVAEPVAIQDELGRTTSYAYDTSGRMTQVTRPEGDGTGYTYDANGNVTATTANAKGGGSSVMSSAFYPCSAASSCNQPQWTKDGNGNETDYAYDPSTGQPTSVTLPAGANGVHPQTRYSYANTGGVSLLTGISQCRTASSCAGTADEVKTTIAYNANLLPTSVSKGAGDGSVAAANSYAYDAVGNVASIDGPLPGSVDATTFSYDADRELTSVLGPDPDGGGPLKRRGVVYHYLPSGLQDSVVVGTVDGSGNFSALQTAVTSFDAYRRKVQSTISAGGATFAITQYGYDGYGRPSCTAQRMNPSSWTSQGDACSLATAGSFGNDRITRVAQYDALNRATQLTTGYGTPEAATEQTAYTPNGKTQSVTDANGNVTSYAYDAYDRLQTTTYPGGSYEQLSYDAIGNVTHRRLRDGNGVDYGYDALNRMQHNSPAGERGVAYNYDNQGHLVEAAYDGLGSGDAVTMSWDALGRLATSTTRQGGVARTVGYGYDAAGRETSITHPDGVQFTMAYDTLGELSQAWWNTPATGTVPFLTYAFDDLGRSTSVNRASSYTYYGYDAASRLTSYSHAFNGTNGNTSVTLGYSPAAQIASRTESSPEYAWTGAVNVNRGYAVNALNQYTTAGPATFAYDGRGNLTSDGSTTYGYDLENRLTSTSRGGGATLAYDPLGRLWQVSGPNGTTRFLYDGDHEIAEYDANNTLLRRFYWGPGADAPVLQDEGGAMNCSGTRFLHPDERGSIVAIADCSGNRQQTNQYDEHGIPGSGNWGRLQYTGQAWLPEVGMYYFKARMYSPTLGRFMQTDPIGYGDGLNRYAYAHGDPVNGIDPSGLYCNIAGSEDLGREDCANAHGDYTPDITVNGQRYVSESIDSGMLTIQNPSGSGLPLTLNDIQDQDIVVVAHKTPSLVPQNNDADRSCQRALSIGGDVTAQSLNGSFIPGVGAQVSVGMFQSANGHVSGSFRTVGAGLGFDVGGSLTVFNYYSNIQNFVGLSFNASGTYGVGSLSISTNQSFSGLTGGSASVGPPSKAFSVTASRTYIYDCSYGS